MKILLGFAFGFLFGISVGSCNKAHADPVISAGVDVLHDRGASYLEIREVKDNYTYYVGLVRYHPRVGADLLFTNPVVDLAIGVAAAQPDEVVSTALRYELRLSKDFGKRFIVSLHHESNCKSICDGGPLAFLPHGGKKSDNDGYNLVTVGYRF